MQSGAIKDSQTKFPRSVQYFMFADQSCDGGESNIRECREIQYSLTTCNTTQLGSVVCQPGKGTSNMHADTIAHLILSIIITANCTNGTVRLVGGSTIREGRVDVCTTQGHWAIVCYNEELELASTVCKMLGFPMQGSNA